MAVKKALTIAGSDSGGGAGIQADLKTFAALGVYGSSVVTAVTAQNTVEVRDIHRIPPAFVASQIETVLDDIGADAVKTGMLASAETVEAVASVLSASKRPLVVDPVLLASSGEPLIDEAGVQAIKEHLLPLALVATPNLQETEALTGLTLTEIDAVRDAARMIAEMGPKWVVIKGGHLSGDPIDLVFDGEDFIQVPGERIDTPNTHGTGCTFSSAITAGLARGRDMFVAIKRAKEYVTAALSASYRVGKGHSPVHHFHDVWE